MFSRNKGYPRGLVHAVAGMANDKISDLKYQIEGLEEKVERLEKENRRLRNQLNGSTRKGANPDFLTKPLNKRKRPNW